MSGFFKSFAVSARKLQKHAEQVGLQEQLASAFAVLDQFMMEVKSCNGVALNPNMVPVMVARPVAKRAFEFARSVGVHAQHCALLGYEVHYAQSAAIQVRSQLPEAHKHVEQLHQAANAANTMTFHRWA